ncbi:hypothetical protein MARHY3471 [Marinobacter nauticus ATCC 49840]|nr:hypothetical protein MARHY3471 [Marinobacter nauticus ATCC 49840]
MNFLNAAQSQLMTLGTGHSLRLLSEFSGFRPLWLQRHIARRKP